MTGATERAQHRSDVISDPQRSSTRRLTALVIHGGVIVLFTVALLAAGLAGAPRFTPPRWGAQPLPPPEPEESQTIQPAPPPQSDDGPPLLMLVLATVIILIVLAVLIAGLVWLIKVLLSYLRTRRVRLRPGTATEGESTADLITEQAVDEPTVRRGITAAQTAISAHAEAGDAIVAAWVGLEETASASGTGRAASETPAEFALRILLRRPGIEAPARSLLALYESVRFGGREADESMREKARADLEQIEEGWR